MGMCKLFLAHPAFRPKMSLCHRVASVVCCLSIFNNIRTSGLPLLSNPAFLRKKGNTNTILLNNLKLQFSNESCI